MLDLTQRPRQDEAAAICKPKHPANPQPRHNQNMAKQKKVKLAFLERQVAYGFGRLFDGDEFLLSPLVVTAGGPRLVPAPVPSAGLGPARSALVSFAGFALPDVLALLLDTRSSACRHPPRSARPAPAWSTPGASSRRSWPRRRSTSFLQVQVLVAVSAPAGRLALIRLWSSLKRSYPRPRCSSSPRWWAAPAVRLLASLLPGGRAGLLLVHRVAEQRARPDGWAPRRPRQLGDILRAADAALSPTR